MSHDTYADDFSQAGGRPSVPRAAIPKPSCCWLRAVAC